MRARLGGWHHAIAPALLAVVAGACGASHANATADAGTLPPGDDAGAADAASSPADAASDDATAGDPGPFPLGATWGANAMHFRVRADPAEAVELDVYTSPRGAHEVARYAMTRASAPGSPWAADVPHAALTALGVPANGPVYYGYRAWGPNWHRDPAWTKGSLAGFVADVDAQGDRFDPNKLLIDPYAREISHDPLQPGALSSAPYTTGPTSRAVDDGQLAPKSIALPPDGGDFGSRPARALADDVVYEVHVRGLTMGDPSVPQALRGTFAGAATKAGALAALGVTAIELLPIHETQNDQNDTAQQGANYWGYSTLAYFAPDRRYAADKSPGGPTRELKAMVKAFHAQGIKVFLDVVYNHTAEGGVSGSNPAVARVYSLRGLDNAGYYELAADHETPVDDTGTGGNVNAASPVVRDLVVDSLTYWNQQIGIDGFRFDLAAVLGNSCASVCYKFAPGDPNGILARAVGALPAGTALIAEPWGVGNGTYQLGHFPAGWSEWNGTFRDDVHIAQNELGTTPITPATIAAKVAGSPDLFDHDGRAPWASIDYVDCHDGFTLRDEYAFNAPQNNQPYPLGPSPGGSASEDSWDQGGSAAAQRQAARTAIALVAVSAGVPMFQGGDEMLRTQYGNDNAYNLDDSSMWLDWSLATTNADFVSWTKALLTFRAAHAALRPRKFFDGTDHDGNGLPDVAWLDTTGAAASATYMGSSNNHFLAWRVDGQEAGDTARSIYVAWNGWTADITGTVPAAGGGKAWYVAGDSASGAFAAPGAEAPLGGGTLDVKARSVAVLVER